MRVVHKKILRALQHRPRVNVKKRLVFYNGSPAVQLPPTQFRLFLLVYFHGRMELENIVDLLYADCPDGGPLGGHRSVIQNIFWTNRKLEKVGLAIRTSNNNWRELVEA